MGSHADDRGRLAARLAGRGAGVVKVPARIRFPGGHAMTRAARLLVGLVVLLVGTPDLAAQTGGEAASSASAPIDWLGAVIFAALAITAVAIAAALVAVRRLGRANALQGDIFGAVPQPRQVVDSQGGTILANKAFYDFFGGVEKPTPELLAAEMAGDDEARDQLDRLAANARNGIPGYAELPVRARGGPENDGAGGRGDRQAEWRYVAAYPVAGRPGTVLWIVDDITMRRQLEQVVREEQERFVDLLERAPIGFYSVDGDGKFLFANQTLCDWLNMSHEDLESGAIHLHDVIAEALPEGTPPYDPFGGGDVVEREGGDAVGADHLRNGLNATDAAVARGNVLVGDEPRARQQQGHTADGETDQDQLLPDRGIAQEPHQRPSFGDASSRVARSTLAERLRFSFIRA